MLTITAERSRVAQELHDSLGHSLMALSMNLDYAKKIFDAKPELVKEVLGKAKDLSQKSISDLRNAVDVLREERQIEDLGDSIAELISNFGRLEKVEIAFSLDRELENTNAELKNCIYKTIQEGLTNGLRHGKATAFDIRAHMTDGSANLMISDNGSGCDEVTESVGLKGISQRIAALGGSVRYNSRKGNGFEITAEIPVSKEDSNND